MTTPVDKVLAALPDARKNGSGWAARCPAHPDKRASLSVAVGDNGGAVVHCHAGCSPEAVAAALGLKLADFMPPNGGPAPRKAAKPKSPARVYPTAEAALLSYGLGEPCKVWRYETAQGDEVGAVGRWDTPEGKQVRPVARVDGGWACAAMPEPRPLYNLPVIHELDGPVYVTEGEKAADCAAALGLLSTTSPSGAQAAGKADWRPLAGRDVVLLPDADGPGRKYAAQVAGILAELSPPARVRVVELPDLPDGGDIVDFRPGVPPERIRAEVEALAAAAPVEAADAQAEAQALFSGEPEAEPSPEPGAQADAPEPWQPFPVELLPPRLRDFVTATADALDCEPAFVALPTLPVVAAAVGTTRAIELKASWQEPCIVWAAVVARSGTLKSPAFDAAVKPLRRLQTQVLRRYAEDCELHAAKGKSTGEKPPPPPARYLTADATLEALAPMLERNPRGLLVARDELSGWVRSFDAYKAKGRGGDAAGWLEVWRAGTLCVDRKTSTSHYVPRAAVSVCGTIQPGVLAAVLSCEHFENGLAARLLLASPPERLKVWTTRVPPRQTVDAYARLVGELLALEHADGEHGPEPLALPLSREARPLWEAWYNQHAERQHNAPTEKLAASLAKVEAYAARFALLFTLCNEPHAHEIPPDALAAGCKLADWFAAEQERMYGTLGQAEETGDAQRLAALVAQRGGRLTARELQRCCRSYATAQAAEAALDALVKSGRGKWEYPPASPTGGRPSRVFVLTVRCQNPPETGGGADKTPGGAIVAGGLGYVNGESETDEAHDAAGWVDGEEIPEELRFAEPNGGEPVYAPLWANRAERNADGLTAVQRAAQYRREAGNAT